MVLRLTALTLALAATTASAAPRSPASLKLVPFPKQVKLTGGTLDISKAMAVDDAATVYQLLRAELVRAKLPAPEATRIRRLGSARPVMTLAPRYATTVTRTVPTVAEPTGHGDEAYSLVVSPRGVTVRGAGHAGLLHGVQTLVQLIRANRTGTKLPCMVIRDWPSLRWRAFQDDLTRGPSSTLTELKREADIGASLKFNVFTYYMEHQFAHRKHPVIGPKDGSLTPSDLRALVQYAKSLGLDVMGNQQSFAHFYNILKHEQYAALRETMDVLTPAREESYRLLDDLYSEVMPALPFPFFNVCGDETGGIGTGPAKEMTAKLGVGAVYAGHMRRVHDLVAARGKRMMMWGDIILGHRDQLSMIPKDTIMLTWGYDPRDNFEGQIVPFEQAGYRFFVCPGVSNWSRVLPDTQESFPNIRNFIRDGVKHNTWGALITAWDDDGETINAPNWYGFAWGAECAWNASTTRREDFDRRVGPALFGPKCGDFGVAMGDIEGLARWFGPAGLLDARFWQVDAGPVDVRKRAEYLSLLGDAQVALVRIAQCQSDSIANREVLDAFLFGVKRYRHVLKGLYLRTVGAQVYQAAAAAGGDKAQRPLGMIAQGLRDERTELRELCDAFARLWKRENRSYALDWTLARYGAADKRLGAMLDKLQQASADVRAGKPLPPAREFGLEIVR